MKKLEYLQELRGREEAAAKKHRQTLDVASAAFQELEKLGGEILFISKEIINATINDRLAQADSFLRDAKKKVGKFQQKIGGLRADLGQFIADPQFSINLLQQAFTRLNFFEKEFSHAKEEYYEALILYTYIKKNGRTDVTEMLLTPEELRFVGFETYAGSLADICGELLRKVRLDIIKNPDYAFAEAEKVHQDMLVIYQIISNFSFSNKCMIRPKIENLKIYILKLEELLYELGKKERQGERKFKRFEPRLPSVWTADDPMPRKDSPMEGEEAQ